MELTKLSIGELKRLKSRVESEITRRTDSTRKDLLKKISKLTAEAGLSLEDVIGKAESPARSKRGAKKAAAPKTKSGGKVAPKYRNPENGAETWTGRGRKPVWVAKALEGGKALGDLLIK